MASSSIGLLFLLSLLGGGTSDLLDVIPADEYWRAKNAEVSEAFLRAELAAAPPIGNIAKLIDALGDDVAATRDAAAGKIRGMGPAVIPQLLDAAKGGNPEVAAQARRLVTEIRAGGGKAEQVRKLMAIRTAGERKIAGLLPRLRELEKAPEPFVPDYASAAVAAVEGKPYVRKRPAAGAADAWMMPAATRALIHMEMTGVAKPLTAEDLARAAKSAATFGGGGGGGGNAGEPPADAATAQVEQVRAMLAQVIGVAERVGNVRVDAVTVGVAGDVGQNAGYVALVARGQYDAKAVGDYLAEVMGAGGPAGGDPAAAGANAPRRESVAGVDVFRPMPTMALLFPNNTHAALVGGPAAAQMPVEELAGLLKAGKPGPLKDVPEMANVVGQIDPSLPLWGAVHVTEAYRQAPPLRALDQVLLTGRPKGEGVALRIDAKGRNGPGVAESVAMVNQGVAMAREQLKKVDEFAPNEELKKVLRIAADLFASVKCEADAADATKASLTAELSAPPATLLMGLVGVGTVGVRPNAAPAPQPAPPPVQPPQP